MKIAVPTRNEEVDDHFGHCDIYTIFNINNDNLIASTETMPSPQGCGCKSNIAEKLKSENVTVLLAGSMGNGALNKLNASGIRVIRGCSGKVTDAVNKYLQGEMNDSGLGCLHVHTDGHTCQH